MSVHEKCSIPAEQRILVSEDDAAELLSISKPVFRAFVADGHVRPVTLPRRVRRNLYLRRELEELAERMAS